MAENLRNYKIKASVFSIEEGNKVFDSVKSIRIESSKYNILIMEDYLPVIGEVDGTVTITTTDSEIKFENIIAYYKHSKNEFSLLVKGRKS